MMGFVGHLTAVFQRFMQKLYSTNDVTRWLWIVHSCGFSTRIHTLFEDMFVDSPDMTGKITLNLIQSNWLLWQRFEVSTSWVQILSFIATPTCLAEIMGCVLYVQGSVYVCSKRIEFSEIEKYWHVVIFNYISFICLIFRLIMDFQMIAAIMYEGYSESNLNLF
jgi:hypothetical protein